MRHRIAGQFRKGYATGLSETLLCEAAGGILRKRTAGAFALTDMYRDVPYVYYTQFRKK